MPRHSIPRQNAKPQLASWLTHRKKVLCITILGVLAAFAIWMLFGSGPSSPNVSQESLSAPTVPVAEHQATEPSSGKQKAPDTSSSKGQTESPAIDLTKYSLTDPNSLWVIVNKKRPLQPASFAPSSLVVANVPQKYERGTMESQLRPETARALEALVAGAKQSGVHLMQVSGYRSYSYQKNLFNYYVSSQGREVAERQSAHPGHSEHQTGWAVDVGATNRKCEIETCFGSTPEGRWVATNAHHYGFVIRYQQGKTSITGYDYEPWHLRFVGTELAQAVKNMQNQPLETIFKLPAAPTY